MGGAEGRGVRLPCGVVHGGLEARPDCVVGIARDHGTVVASISVAAFGVILICGDIFFAEEIDIRTAIGHARGLHAAHAVGDAVLEVGEHSPNIRRLLFKFFSW